MVLRKIFPAMFAAPDKAPVESRKATTYLLRCVFLMGIKRPPKNFLVLYCLWSIALHLCSTIYQPIGFMTGYIIHLSEYSPSQFLNSMQVAINAWACSTKVIIFWFKAKRLDRANLILDEMDKRVTQPGERRKIHNAVSSSNRIFFTYMSVYVIFAMSSFISAMLMGLPMYQNYYPWLDWQASQFQFYLQSALELFSVLGAIFQDVCIDCYPINYVVILRAHLANFADRLRQLGNDPNEHPDQRYEKLIDCIEDHKIYMRYCETLNPAISITIFVQLLVVGLIIGFTLINIVMFANVGSFISTFIFMTAVLLETTPFCILCNYLTDDCYKVADALFESNWIHQEQRYKKTVLQFLQRLQKPIIFMAGNVFIISVATNINATKFAFSVFTLVKQMNIAEKLSKPQGNLVDQ